MQINSAFESHSENKLQQTQSKLLFIIKHDIQKKSLLEMAIKTNIQHEVFLIQHITAYIKPNNKISVNPRDLSLPQIIYHYIDTKEAEFTGSRKPLVSCIILNIKGKTVSLLLC